MPPARAAPARERPSSTRASASMRRAAFASRHRFASRRSSAAPGSFRVIATVMAPPPIGYTADQRPRAAHGAVALTVRCRGRWYYLAGTGGVDGANCRPLRPVDGLADAALRSAPALRRLGETTVRLAPKG